MNSEQLDLLKTLGQIQDDVAALLSITQVQLKAAVQGCQKVKFKFCTDE